MTCFPEPHWQEDSRVPTTGRIVESKLVASLYAQCKYYIGRIQTECTGPESRCWWVANRAQGTLSVPWDVLSRTNGGKCPELTLLLGEYRISGVSTSSFLPNSDLPVAIILQSLWVNYFQAKAYFIFECSALEKPDQRIHKRILKTSALWEFVEAAEYYPGAHLAPT